MSASGITPPGMITRHVALPLGQMSSAACAARGRQLLRPMQLASRGRAPVELKRKTNHMPDPGEGAIDGEGRHAYQAIDAACGRRGMAGAGRSERWCCREALQLRL